MSVALRSSVGGVELSTPIMPASGTFSFELEQAIDLSRLGALVLKTATYTPRDGNPVPRVSETYRGMLNSIGLPGGGIDQFIVEVLPKYRDIGPPVVASISADTADQFAEMAGLLAAEGVAAIELNISCPNIEADGQAFAMDPVATGHVVQGCREASSAPLWAKLTPNTGRIADIAAAAEDAGADALVVANTILGLSINVETRRPSLGNVMGGLSGPAVKPIILRMVYQCARQVTIPIIGCGGISSGADVVEYLLAGASAVQVGTETFIDPTALIRIEAELIAYCKRHGIRSFKELIQQVEDQDAPEGSHDMLVAP